MQGSKALMSLMLQAPTGYDVCEDAGGGFVMPPMQPGDPNDEDTPPQPAMPFGPPMGEPGEEPDEAMKDMMQMMMGPKKAATREVMDQMIADAVKKVKRWQELGFDGISIHMAYTAPFCAKMLSPLTNHRTDEFGGPIENRSRFPLMLCGAIKEACGDKFLVEVLMSGKEAPGGITVEDTVAFAKLAEGKMDILQLRGGDGDESHPTTVNSTSTPITLAIAQVVKDSGAKITVAPIGGFEDPDLAEQWMAEGKMDLMAAGWAFVCEPDYVKKLHEGRGEDIVPCIRCNKCHGLSMNGPWLTACSVNPKLGLDHVKDRIFPEPDRSKKVAIIGGSEIGCETGMYVAESGRDVTVFTRQNQLAPSAQRVHYGLPALGYHGLKQKLCCTTTAVEGGTLHYCSLPESPTGPGRSPVPSRSCAHPGGPAPESSGFRSVLRIPIPLWNLLLKQVCQVPGREAGVVPEQIPQRKKQLWRKAQRRCIRSAETAARRIRHRVENGRNP